MSCSSTTESNPEERRQEDGEMHCKENVKTESEGQDLHDDACSTVPVAREEDWVIASDETFLNGIIHEFEQFEKNYHSEVPNETISNRQEPRHPSNTHRLANHTSTAITNQEKHAEIEVTPSRSRFVSHITPVTLLPPAHLNKIPDKHWSQTNTHQPLQPLQTTANTSIHIHSSALHSTPAARPSTQQRQHIAPQPLTFAKTPHTLTASTYSPQTLSSTVASELGNTAVVTPSTAATHSNSFRTPSTTQWMKVKSSLSTSPSPSSLDSPQPFNGGKITPPLCNCGKRAKRKTVTNPGPNQGKPFFSCPGGREAGCQYFRWENSSPSTSHAHCSTVNLSSEYT